MATENNEELTTTPANQPPNSEVKEPVQPLSEPQEPVAENPANIAEPPEPVQNDKPQGAEVQEPKGREDEVEPPANEQKLPEANENAENNQAAAPIDITEKDWQRLGQQIASLFEGGGQQRMYSPGIHSIQRLGQQQTINIGRRTGVIAATMQTRHGPMPVVYSGNEVYALRPGRRGGRFVRITNPELLADLRILQQVQPEKAPEAQQPGQAIKAEQPERKLAEPKVPIEQPEAAAVQKNGEPDVKRAQNSEVHDDSPGAVPPPPDIQNEQEAGREEQVAGPVEPGAPVAGPGQPASKEDEILTVRLASGTKFRINEDGNLITVE